MAKKYYEGHLVRFLYWPKTALFGNHYHYLSEAESLSGNISHHEEKSSPTTDNKNKRYHTIKLPRSGFFSRILALVLYPVFNPLAFFLTQAINFFYQQEYMILCNAINTEKENGRKYKSRIRNKLNLVEDVKDAIKTFHEKETKFLKKWNEFQKKLTTVTAWSAKENIEEFNKIFTKVTRYFPLLIGAMKETMKNEKTFKKSSSAKVMSLLEPEGIAARIVIQPQNLNRDNAGKPAFAFRFVNSLLIHMYHFARNENFYILIEPDKNQFRKTFPSKNMQKHNNAENFYKSGTPQYQWRQGFNTNMKLFYSSLFGRESGRSAFLKADKRFYDATSIDTSKNETTFILDG